MLTRSLEKPWSNRPACADPVETELPGEISSEIGRPPLPPALLAAVENAPPQESMTDYDTVHAWWWAVYDGVLAELKVVEPEAWRDVDRFVKHQ